MFWSEFRFDRCGRILKILQQKSSAVPDHEQPPTVIRTLPMRRLVIPGSPSSSKLQCMLEHIASRPGSGPVPKARV